MNQVAADLCWLSAAGSDATRCFPLGGRGQGQGRSSVEVMRSTRRTVLVSEGSTPRFSSPTLDFWDLRSVLAALRLSRG